MIGGATFVASTRWCYWPRSAWLWFGFERGKVIFRGLKGLKIFSIHNLSVYGLYISLACFHFDILCPFQIRMSFGGIFQLLLVSATLRFCLEGRGV